MKDNESYYTQCVKDLRDCIGPDGLRSTFDQIDLDILNYYEVRNIVMLFCTLSKIYMEY